MRSFMQKSIMYDLYHIFINSVISHGRLVQISINYY